MASMQPDLEPETELHAQAETSPAALRLRHAIGAMKIRDVADRAGIPIGTLNHYLRGREMRAASAARIAQATGVRLEWLATGEGPMRAGMVIGPPSVAGTAEHAPPATPFRLFGNVRIDRLVQAYEGAMASTRGNDRRLTMHLTVVLYDQLTEAEELQSNQSVGATGPQTSSQKAPQS